MQLSSGIGGPPECAYAVGGIFKDLQREFPSIQLADARPTGTEGCYSSITFTCEEDLSRLAGTLLWVCESPLRPHHKRKNWYIGLSVIPETVETSVELSAGDLHVEHFHAGGPGGQNVNKVETGVRVTHIPTGIVASSTSERTQHANRRIAEARLSAILAARNAQAKADQKDAAWRAHGSFERGNPVRTYCGLNFKLDA